MPLQRTNSTGVYTMKTTPLILGALLLAGILATPAAAFTITSLAVNIGENGDAGVTVDYSLSWMERFAVYTRIAHPDQQLETALESFSGKEVAVHSVSPAQTTLVIGEFAARAEDEPGTTYTTPALDFTLAGQKARGYWFSRFVTLDLSPDQTVIAFPDGYEATFTNVAYIPSVSHTIGQ